MGVGFGALSRWKWTCCAAHETRTTPIRCVPPARRRSGWEWWATRAAVSVPGLPQRPCALLRSGVRSLGRVGASPPPVCRLLRVRGAPVPGPVGCISLLPFAMLATAWCAVPVWRFCPMVRAAACFSLVLVAASAAGAGISGVSSVTDGDTLRIGSERIRLHGIDAPESAQSCRAGGKTWPCGEAATRALRERIGRRRVECAERDRDHYGRIVAVCRVAGADVNAWMVDQGWAVAYRKYSTDYVSHETAAKRARRGVWRGDFVEPSRWRRGERLEATAGSLRAIAASRGTSAARAPASTTCRAARSTRGPASTRRRASGGSVLRVRRARRGGGGRSADRSVLRSERRSGGKYGSCRQWKT